MSLINSRNYIYISTKRVYRVNFDTNVQEDLGVPANLPSDRIMVGIVYKFDDDKFYVTTAPETSYDSSTGDLMTTNNGTLIYRMTLQPLEFASFSTVLPTVGVNQPFATPLMGLSYDYFSGGITLLNPFDTSTGTTTAIYNMADPGTGVLTVIGGQTPANPPYSLFCTLCNSRTAKILGVTRSLPNNSSQDTVIRSLNRETGELTPFDGLPLHIDDIILSAFYDNFSGRYYFVTKLTGSPNSRAIDYLGLAGDATLTNLNIAGQTAFRAATIQPLVQATTKRTLSTSMASVGDTIVARYDIEFVDRRPTPTAVGIFLKDALPLFLKYGNVVSKSSNFANPNILSSQRVMNASAHMVTTSIYLEIEIICQAPGTLTADEITTDGLIQTGNGNIPLVNLASDPLQVVAMCVHENTLVQTEYGEKKISEIATNDICLDLNQQGTKIKSIRFCGTSTCFVKLHKHSLGTNIPSKSFLIMASHPILIGGIEILAGDLVNHVTITEQNFEEPQKIYTLVTSKRTFILMNNVPVATWGKLSLNNFLQNDISGQLFQTKLN